MFADRYTVVDDQTLPTGEYSFVSDFGLANGQRTAFADVFEAAHASTGTSGLDHNFEVTISSIKSPSAQMYDPESGRCLTVRALKLPLCSVSSDDVIM